MVRALRATPANTLASALFFGVGWGGGGVLGCGKHTAIYSVFASFHNMMHKDV